MDVLATAVVAAAKKLECSRCRLFLRLEGTNVEEGRAIIAESGMKVQIGSTMKEAADMAVAAAKDSLRFRSFSLVLAAFSY